jgi:hypothetical protein
VLETPSTMRLHLHSQHGSVSACSQSACSAGDWRPSMRALAEKLVKVQRFYDALGGIVGYQLKCLQLIYDARAEAYAEMTPQRLSLDGSSSGTGTAPSVASEGTSAGCTEETEEQVDYLVPQGPKFNTGVQGQKRALHAAGDGLRALPQLAEIYPLGGAHGAGYGKTAQTGAWLQGRSCMSRCCRRRRSPWAGVRGVRGATACGDVTVLWAAVAGGSVAGLDCA